MRRVPEMRIDVVRSLVHLLLTGVLLVASVGAQDDSQPGGVWSGRWESTWRGSGALIDFRQKGDLVAGRYGTYGGVIEGRVEGDRLVGTWSERRSSGSEFVVTAAYASKSSFSTTGIDQPSIIMWW